MRYFYSFLFCQVLLVTISPLNASCRSIPSIDDVEVICQDIEYLLPVIQQYSPVVYLHREEQYFPITAEEYCTGLHTAVAHQSDNSVVIQRGAVTMDALYALHLTYQQQNKKPDLYLDITESVRAGSNPRENTDHHHNLTTPCSVLTWQNDSGLYIQYLYLYGYNAPYSIGLIHGDVLSVQDAHEADLEHVTLMLDKDSGELKKIYYSVHGKNEGVWMDAHHPDVSYEGTHPVSYSSRGSHANYPREGTYVRIFGAANDHTDKGIRWTPILRRIYKNDDDRFDPSTMGWCYHAGNLGKRGVAAPYNQGWFGNAKNDVGRDYNTVLFCLNPGSSCFVDGVIDEAQYRACLLSKIPSAEIPD